MDEQAFRRIVREEVDASVSASEARLEARLTDKIATAVSASEARLEARLTERMAATVSASEARLAENGRMMFRQLADFYRSTVEKIDHLEKHLGDQIAQTRGAIESLRASLERQDFRTDELARRVTALETRPQPRDDI
jgi:hypothetical protein